MIAESMKKLIVLAVLSTLVAASVSVLYVTNAHLNTYGGMPSSFADVRRLFHLEEDWEPAGMYYVFDYADRKNPDDASPDVWRGPIRCISIDSDTDEVRTASPRWDAPRFDTGSNLRNAELACNTLDR